MIKSLFSITLLVLFVMGFAVAYPASTQKNSLNSTLRFEDEVAESDIVGPIKEVGHIWVGQSFPTTDPFGVGGRVSDSITITYDSPNTYRVSDLTIGYYTSFNFGDQPVLIRISDDNSVTLVSRSEASFDLEVSTEQSSYDPDTKRLLILWSDPGNAGIEVLSEFNLASDDRNQRTEVSFLSDRMELPVGSSSAPLSVPIELRYSSEARNTCFTVELVSGAENLAEPFTPRAYNVPPDTRDAIQFSMTVALDAQASGELTAPLVFAIRNVSGGIQASTNALGEISVWVGNTVTGLERYDSGVVSLYPIPASQTLSISLGDQFILPETVIEIYNLQGVLLQQVSPRARQHQVEVASMATGAYILKVRDEAGYYSQTLLIE